MRDQEIGQTLRGLIRKKYVKKKEDEPYRLTKLGIRAVKGHKSVSKGRARANETREESRRVYVTTARIDTTGGAIQKWSNSDAREEDGYPYDGAETGYS